MNRLRLAALVALVAALALFALAAAQGDLRVGLILFIPFVAGEGVAPFLGGLLLMLALVLWFAGTRLRPLPPPGMEWGERATPGDPDRPPERARHGGIILIGPIPIVWGNDRRIIPWLVAAGLVLLVLGLLLTWGLR